VRDAILARVADPRSAGVLAALVVGDQNAIDGLRYLSSRKSRVTQSAKRLASTMLSTEVL
jgi:hypothetical protein